MIDSGSGSNWLVDLFNRGPTNTWVNIGDLSSAGGDWTTVALTVTSSALTNYLDASSDNEMLVRVYTADLFEVRMPRFGQLRAPDSSPRSLA